MTTEIKKSGATLAAEAALEVCRLETAAAHERKDAAEVAVLAARLADLKASAALSLLSFELRIHVNEHAPLYLRLVASPERDGVVRAICQLFELSYHDGVTVSSTPAPEEYSKVRLAVNDSELSFEFGEGYNGDLAGIISEFGLRVTSVHPDPDKLIREAEKRLSDTKATATEIAKAIEGLGLPL